MSLMNSELVISGCQGGYGTATLKKRVGIFMIAILSFSAASTAKAADVHPRVGLDGYDPTAIIDDNKLAKGQSARSAKFDGVTYHFASRASRSKFLKSPQKYVPALGGQCIVCYAKFGKRIAGSIRHASLHNDRLYLFPSRTAKQEFLDNAELYEDADLIADGDSVVWLLHEGRRVEGSPTFSEVYRGFRYQFASRADQLTFRRNQARYAGLIMSPAIVARLAVAQTESQISELQLDGAEQEPEMAYLEPPRPPISFN